MRSSALFLVGYENWASFYSAFKQAAAAEKNGKYNLTLDGYISFLIEAFAQHTTNSAQDAVASRRIFHMYLATLLKIAQNRAGTSDGNWDGIAEVWIRLLPGARFLRTTIDETDLWSSREVRGFEDIKTESDGESYCFLNLMPVQVQQHPKIGEWKDKDLSPEMKTEIDSMVAEVQKMMNS